MIRRTAAACAILGATAVCAGGTFRFERSVTPGGPGPNRLAADASILAGASPVRPGSSGGLEDLRFFDAAGREVPYLLIPPDPAAPSWIRSRLSPVAPTKASSGFDADLGEVASVDRIRLEGIRAPFLKRFRLEGSGDRERWVVLIAEGTLFDLPDEKLRRIEADFPAGEYRYLRVMWDDRQSARVPVPERVSARLEKRTAPAPAARIAVSFERRESEPGKSRFLLHLPGPHLPLAALELSVSAGNLLRPAEVSEPRLTGAIISPVRLGESTLRCAEIGGIAASDLRVAIQPPEGSDLELAVDDGDNPPIALSGVTAEMAPLPWIFFQSPDGAALTARFGDPMLRAPRYDIEAMRRYVLSRKLADATWGAVRDSSPPPAASPAMAAETGALIDRSKFLHSRQIPAGPPGLNALLLDAAVLAGVSDIGEARIADQSGRQIPYVLEHRSEPLVLDLNPPARKEERESSPRVSSYRVELPFARLPASQLVLTTAARVFERSVVAVVPTVGGNPRDSDDLETVLSSATWRHAETDLPAPPVALELPTISGRLVELRIEEGDNAPLPLGATRLVLPAYRLRFFRPASARLTLLYGNSEIGAPQYDIALLASRVLGSSAKEISLSAAPTPSAPSQPDKQSRVFWVVLVAVALILVAVIGRLVSKATV